MASIPLQLSAGCMLVNQGRRDQAKEAALGTLIDRKYVTAEDHFRMLKTTTLRNGQTEEFVAFLTRL